MQMDDMILVSIDDHFIEPPDMSRDHVPAKWRDAVPKVVRTEDGTDQWVFPGERTSTTFGLAAMVASMNFPTMAGFNARTFTACRFFDWDPFEHTPREQTTVGALRARATDVDVTRRPKEEWRKMNEAAGIGVFT